MGKFNIILWILNFPTLSSSRFPHSEDKRVGNSKLFLWLFTPFFYIPWIECQFNNFLIKIDLIGDKIINVCTYSTFEQMIWPNGSVKIIQFSTKGQKVNNSLIELRYLLCSRKYDWLLLCCYWTFFERWKCV